MKWFLLGSMGFFSLLVGSFFTVVVYRLPLILQRQWQREYSLFLASEKSNYLSPTFNLALPFSHCPVCQRILSTLHKIPLLSYIFLKGKCAYCQKRISLLYPLIEALTLICSLCVVWRFGLSLQMLASLILTWGLILLAFIDLKQGLLPDMIVLPLLWLGLILNTLHLFVSPETAILGTILAYLSLWTLARCYQIVTKREGMGQGDFKCFALLGAWLGIASLPYILFIASFLGSLIGLSLWISKRIHLQTPFPFGPCLSLAGWSVLLLQTYP